MGQLIRQILIRQGICETNNTHTIRNIVVLESLYKLFHRNLMLEGLIRTFDNEIVASGYLSGTCHYAYNVSEGTKMDTVP